MWAGTARAGAEMHCVGDADNRNGFDMAYPSSAPRKPAWRMVEGRIYSKMIGYESEGDTQGPECSSDACLQLLFCFVWRVGTFSPLSMLHCSSSCFWQNCCIPLAQPVCHLSLCEHHFCTHLHLRACIGENPASEMDLCSIVIGKKEVGHSVPGMWKLGSPGGELDLGKM